MKKIIIFLFLFILMAPAIAFSDVRVYDAGDQYLGVLIEYDTTGLKVYVPKVNKVLYISYEDGNIHGINLMLYFTGTGCTGTPYVLSNTIHNYIFEYSSTYYERNTADNCQEITVKSDYHYGGNCDDYEQVKTVCPLIEVQKESLPFTTPITLPIRLDYSSEKRKAAIIPLTGN